MVLAGSGMRMRVSLGRDDGADFWSPGSRTLSAMEQMAAFTEARQKLIAENIANVDTPAYQRRQVDLGGFQQALAGPCRSVPLTRP